ncbi:hypothetical protein CANINC_000305 [Pichia inconspicua]|uniref:Uncharacterized protein n=1 Tax=Pichia inconspicua TaxID=52247 RepID=A0A4T0X6D7_9ASCO|nr:hypothetical protein CANINC_000305 [[Candida] inconspicua]
MRKLDKQRKISEFLFKIRDRTKIKRNEVKFNPDIITKSPVFVNPQLYIKKFRMIDESNTLGGYRPLETSAIAHILSSPPRMTHGTRTVVPRDFLSPLRVMHYDSTKDSVETEHEPIKKSKKVKNCKLEYMMVPFHPKDIKVSEDPVIYYPNSLHLFKTYLRSDLPDIAPINKFSFSSTMYPNIKNVDSVAWNRQTSLVIKNILLQNVMEESHVLEIQNNESQSFVIVSKKAEQNPVVIRDGKTVLDGSQYDIELMKLLEKNQPTLEVPVSKETENLIRHLIKYTMYINS